MRLVVCSNSRPAAIDGPGGTLGADGAGGLVPHVLSLLRDHGGEWCFTDHGSGHEWPVTAEGIRLRPVAISADDRRDHYETISIDVLQRMFHYLLDTPLTPSFDHRLHGAWQRYEWVNSAFASEVGAALAAGAEPTTVLVNDYHLLLVPGMARATAGERCLLIYAHGVPWCGPDYFAILPAAVRRAILTSLLSCDVVVFHSARWRTAFAACCDAHVPGVHVGQDSIRFGEHLVRLVVEPFPLDAANVSRLQSDETAQDWRDRLGELADGRRILARVERLDLWKNHVRGFAAYETLLQRQPELRDEVWFVAVTARPRHQSPMHRLYGQRCEQAVRRINARHGRSGRDAVTLVTSGGPAETRSQALATLGTASAILINPTYEGFGIVAKEAVFVSEKSPILLSTTAGAHEQLGHLCVAVEPFDVEATTAALGAALSGGPAVDLARRQRSQERIRSDTAVDWFGRVTSAP